MAANAYMVDTMSINTPVKPLPKEVLREAKRVTLKYTDDPEVLEMLGLTHV